jgi:pyruvate dehydrogenase E2 component (dihydrolipoamide acetyltransferase)
MSHAAITMPALSDTMSNGRLVKWTKKPGDPIRKGEAIAEIETDKAVMDVEAFQDGYLSGPLVVEGTEAPVGQILGYIADNLNEIRSVAASAVEAPQPNAADRNISAKLAVEQPPVSAVLAASMASTRPSPLRRPSPAPGPSGTGARPSAMPTRPEAAAPGMPVANPALSAIAAGPPYRVERASSLREAVARNAVASAATPSFRVTAQLPLEPLMKAAHERQHSLTLVLARACALTIVAHPLFNAAYTPDGLARRDRVDIGIAVESGDGLITPVLRDAASRSLAELARDWSNLREKIKSRRLVPADYGGATFYLSDLGVFSVVYAFDAIVPVGASAILSVAASRRQGAFFTLACDHRVVFGADAARFLETLAQQLKDPGNLLA